MGLFENEQLVDVCSVQGRSGSLALGIDTPDINEDGIPDIELVSFDLSTGTPTTQPKMSINHLLVTPDGLSQDFIDNN